MKKFTTIASFLLLTLALTACQNVSPAERNSADQAKNEKASSASQISLTVKGDPSDKTVVENTQLMTPAADMKIGMIVDESGLSPLETESSVGQSLSVINTLKSQVQLYTTSNGELPCPFMDASFNLDAGATKTFALSQAGSCTVINQQNTSQKAVIIVK